MAQHDYNLANASGAAFRADANDLMQAILTGNSGATAPSVTEAFMIWNDTSTGHLKQRNAANTAWIDHGDLASGILRADQIGLAAGNLMQIDHAETSTATAATVDLSAALRHLLTDTTTVTAFEGVAGVCYRCRAAAAFTLTHHATNLIIAQTGASIVVAAGDTFEVTMITGTTARVTNYQRASGEALVSSVISNSVAIPTTSGTAVDFDAIPAGVRRIKLGLIGVATNGSAHRLIQLGTSSGIVPTGYLTGSSSLGNSIVTNDYSVGFGIRLASSAADAAGCLTLDLVDEVNNVWQITGAVRNLEGSGGALCFGSKAMPGVIDRIRFTTTNGTDSYDGGEVRISWEF
ncbi:MAG: hypothetical protein ABID63_18215 [Pseudomonadota bacterium]